MRAPPSSVHRVFAAVALLLGRRDTSWVALREMLREALLADDVAALRFDDIAEGALAAVRALPPASEVRQSSVLAGEMCLWLVQVQRTYDGLEGPWEHAALRGGKAPAPLARTELSLPFGFEGGARQPTRSVGGGEQFTVRLQASVGGGGEAKAAGRGGGGGGASPTDASEWMR